MSGQRNFIIERQLLSTHCVKKASVAKVDGKPEEALLWVKDILIEKANTSISFRTR